MPDFSSASPCFDQTEMVSKVKEFRVLNKYEELLDKVVSELKEVNKNITSVNSRLLAVETNMSEISMQVSVLDSKLQSVDILVTMEHFEKKWQTLKPWLVSLESMPAKSNVEISHDDEWVSRSFDETFEPDEINTSLPVNSSMSKSALCSVLSSKETKSSPNVKPCQPSLLLDSSSTLINNIGDSSTHSNQLTHYQNEMDESAVAQFTPSLSLPIPINIGDSSKNSNKSYDIYKSYDYKKEINKHQVIETLTTDTDKNTQQCEDTSDTSSTVCSNKTANNDHKVPDKSIDLLENKTDINNASQCKVSLSQSVSNFYKDLFFNSGKEKILTCSDLNSLNEPRISSALQTTNNLETVQNSNERGYCKTATPPHNTLNEKKSTEMYEPENVIQIKHENADIEKEYVIVQTKDIENATQHEERDVLSSTELLSHSSIDKDFQVCSNVTEYLEVNLGKNPDETYEFDFTTKPDTSYPSFSPLSNSLTNITTKPEIPETSYPLFSPLSNRKKIENELKISLSIKDDSFNTFLSDLKTKNSVENKQSSPLVVTTENKSEDSIGCQLLVQKSGITKS